MGERSAHARVGACMRLWGFVGSNLTTNGDGNWLWPCIGLDGGRKGVSTAGFIGVRIICFGDGGTYFTTAGVSEVLAGGRGYGRAWGVSLRGGESGKISSIIALKAPSGFTPLRSRTAPPYSPNLNQQAARLPHFVPGACITAPRCVMQLQVRQLQAYHGCHEACRSRRGRCSLEAPIGHAHSWRWTSPERQLS